MRKSTFALLSIGVAGFLTACGGGDDDSTPAVTNPLSKYAGTYTACDNRAKETIAFVAVGSNQLQATYGEDVYSAANCTGTIVGRVTYSSSIVLTYQDTGSSTASLNSAIQTLTIDRIGVTNPAITVSVSGSGARGNCVYYTGGNICYDPVPASNNTPGGLYMSNKGLYGLEYFGGVYYAEDPAYQKTN